MLRVEDVDVFYGQSQALWEVTFNITDKSLTTIIGPNGAGKTTITQTISGLLHPQAGTIIFKEKHIEDSPPHKIGRSGISLVPEGRKLFRGMSVARNLEAGAYLQDDEKLYQETLEKVFGIFPRLEKRLDQRAGTLSGGEAQMLAVGRALMADPTLLILDEPSLGLAPNLVQSLFQTIAELNEEGLTILIVEQHVKQALKISSKAYLLENGRVTKEASSNEMLEDDHVKSAYLGL